MALGISLVTLLIAVYFVTYSGYAISRDEWFLFDATESLARRGNLTQNYQFDAYPPLALADAQPPAVDAEPLQPALAEVQLLDAAEQAFPRSKEAEFVLRQASAANTMPDQPLPPGSRVEVVVVFDVTNYTSPVRLQLRFAEGTLTSTPTEVQ